MFNFFNKQDINRGIAEYAAMDDAILLDVRTKDEYREGHVPGSKNVDVGKISAVVSMINDKNTPIFVYCLSGGRSSSAVSALKNLGYTNVKNIGGISSYTGQIERGA